MIQSPVKSNILLESGTNEVEIAELGICNQTFGVNVAKIREFIPYDTIDISKMPGRHPSVMGVFILRGHSVPLIDLDLHLGLARECKYDTRQIAVVMEFNNMATAFVADYINQIHRVSWKDFKPLDSYLANKSSMVVGSITIEDREVLVLDLEHIVGEIFPSSIINYDESKFSADNMPSYRKDIKIFFAEDSAIIRTQISKILGKVGYDKLSVFDNGLKALNAIKEIVEKSREEGEDVKKYISLLLTDIEMPQMDGLTLCREVKQELRMETPVVMFSSLINVQMEKKCRSVGADGVANKPETEKLIDLIDKLTLGKVDNS